MDSNENIQATASSRNKEDQAFTELQKIESICTSARNWFKAIAILLILIWLTIIFGPIFLPYLYAAMIL